MFMEKYPLKLAPVPKEILWGGNRLKCDYGKSAPFPSIAESWELTIRPDGVNIVENGPYAGMTLSELMEKHKESLFGTACRDLDRFPLLIKFIDAADALSVQVHPDDSYALAHENEWGKTEMWYIAEAEEGAMLVYGLKDRITLGDFAEAVEKGAIEETLKYTSVKKGDVFYIPSGQVHAIGGGILLAEIQQNSNLTYRVFDYNRPQADGTLRELHIEKALDVICCRTEEELAALRFEKHPAEEGLLCASTYFTVREVDVNGTFSLTVSKEFFLSLLILHAEEASILCHGISYPLAKGDSWLLPAGLGEIMIQGGAEILISSI